MKLEALIIAGVQEAMRNLYGQELGLESIALNETKKEFVGDITVVVFPLTKFSRLGPEQTAEAIGTYLVKSIEYISAFNVVKGFLNLQIANSYWLSFFKAEHNNLEFGKGEKKRKVVLEYCGPNTNKPLHLGHIRNMLLGYSTANLLSFAGNDVHKVNIYNDRGIAICKSMLAWKLFGAGATPESSGLKGDHFVGKFYVEFDKHYKAEVQALVEQGLSKEVAEKQAPLIVKAQEMLVQWEQGDKEVLALWNKMNSWCYEGFEETFKALGVDFEKHYKESDFYLQGKSLVDEGLKKNFFYKKEDGSVWVDLEDKGLDHKLLLRGDGTSVYITQDMGVAEARYQDYQFDESIYVVASEQDYHFKVLQLVLEKLEKPYAEGIYHLSYGLVNLPNGRMKSREGTVVDADDLIAEMIATAEKHTKELGKIDDFTPEEAQALYKTLAMGALKYFMLKVSPKRSMIFNPEESIEFQGDTGPFIQFNYVRIQSLLRKQTLAQLQLDGIEINEDEKDLIKDLYKFPALIQGAAANYDISELVSYCYSLAKNYSKFYANNAILVDTTEDLKNFRLLLSRWVAEVLKSSFGILGIEMPNRM
ncbi:MAG: arginine--tRNA ligase [Chitinophagales bacterium]|nr:arginine--tRNA ligase [Chitinophagales bacterium]